MPNWEKVRKAFRVSRDTLIKYKKAVGIFGIGPPEREDIKNLARIHEWIRYGIENGRIPYYNYESFNAQKRKSLDAIDDFLRNLRPDWEERAKIIEQQLFGDPDTNQQTVEARYISL